jgi:hypothetical protein
MKDKWARLAGETYENTRSALPINTPNLSSSNITADWFRAVKAEPCEVYINGKPLSYYANNNQLIVGAEDIKPSDLENFFKDVILGKLHSSVPDAKKDAMVAHLMKSFHQGGLLYPVTCGITEELLKATTEERLNTAVNNFFQSAKQVPATAEAIRKELSLPNDSELTKQSIKTAIIKQLGANPSITDLNEFMMGVKNKDIKEAFFNKPSKIPIINKHGIVNIVTTSTGFKCQEFVDLPNMLSPDGNKMKPVDKNYVLKAQGTIDIDFSKSSENDSKPTIAIESNTISFGNPDIQKLLDKRNLAEIILDFFKNLIGLNTIEKLAPEQPIKTGPEQDATNFISNKP